MAKSSIEWTDEVWNPVTGCTRVSPGCDHCYAVKLSRRLELMGQDKYAGLTSLNARGDRHFNGVVRTHEDALTIPLKVKRPRRWFVNSMSDLFHKDVPFDFIDRVFAVMALASQHTFQVLTKRPDIAAEYFALEHRGDLIWDACREIADSLGGFEALGLDAEEVSLSFGKCPNWVWLGTSCERQKEADERIPHLLKCPAATLFLSCEPLLDLLDLTPHLWGKDPECPGCPKDADCECGWKRRKDLDCASIGWIIVGGESGPGARPFGIDWARSLIKQGIDAGVPVFVKQLGARPFEAVEVDDTWERRRLKLVSRKGGHWLEWPEDLRVREFPEALKHAAN